MKKAAICIFILIGVVLFQISTHPQQTTFKFGMIMGKNQQDQQLKPVFLDIFKFLSEKQKYNIKMEWFTDDAKFLEAVKNKSLDFAYSKEHDPFIEMVTKYGYEPVTTVTAFDSKTTKCCFYTTSDKKISSIDDMKGLKLLTYYTRDGYYPLRKLLGNSRPETFFSAMIPNSGGQISLKRLLDGEGDIAFVYDANVFMLKTGNPAIVKKLKEVMCAPPSYNPAICVRSMKEVPKELIDGMRSIMSSAHKAEELKKYRTLMKTTKIRFIPITKKDYEPLLSMYSDAAKKGWDKDYLKWRAGLSQ